MLGGVSSSVVGVGQENTMMKTFQLTCWRVTNGVYNETPHTYFATEGLARLAVEWAYQVRLEDLQRRGVAVETYPLGAGSLNPWARKLVWWDEDPEGGSFCRKEYFDADEEMFERTVVE